MENLSRLILDRRLAASGGPPTKHEKLHLLWELGQWDWRRDPGHLSGSFPFTNHEKLKLFDLFCESKRLSSASLFRMMQSANQTVSFGNVRLVRLEISQSWAPSFKLDGRCFTGMLNLRILDICGRFLLLPSTDLLLPESLQFLRFSNNDDLKDELKPMKVPSNLIHFELRQCKWVSCLPDSFYDSLTIQYLILYGCPRVRFAGWAFLNSLRRYHLEGDIEVGLDEVDQVVAGEEHFYTIGSHELIAANQLIAPAYPVNHEFSPTLHTYMKIKSFSQPSDSSEVEESSYLSVNNSETSRRTISGGHSKVVYSPAKRSNSFITDQIPKYTSRRTVSGPYSSEMGSYYDSSQCPLLQVMEGAKGSVQILCRTTSTKSSHSLNSDDGPCCQSSCQKSVTSDSFKLRDCMCTDLDSAFDKIGGIDEELLQYMASLRRLSLEYCRRLTSLTSRILDLPCLVVLELKGCTELQELPPEIGGLTRLQTLDLSECQKLKRLPPSMFGGLKALQELNLCACAALEVLPEGIGQLIDSLKLLRLAGCTSLASLPNSIACLTSLVLLDLSGCAKIRKLPKTVCQSDAVTSSHNGNKSTKPQVISKGLSRASANLGNRGLSTKAWNCVSVHWKPSLLGTCKGKSSKPHMASLKHESGFMQLCGRRLFSLEVLNMNDCLMLEMLPNQIGNLRKLRALSLQHSVGLKKLPNSIVDLAELQYLSLEGCSELDALPSKFGRYLTSMQFLLLRDCQRLCALPESLCTMKSLQELDLSGCSNLRNLPQGFGSLVSLRRLKLANCEGLLELPSSVCNLQSLEELDLHGCYKLQELPAGDHFGKLRSLEKLDLLSCRNFKEFPHIGDGGLTSLEELDLRGTLVEAMVGGKGEFYFAGLQRVRRFLTFCSSRKGKSSSEDDTRVEWILWDGISSA